MSPPVRLTAPRLRIVLPLICLLCFGGLLHAPRARAYLYWTSYATGLTRAGNDGSGLGFLINTQTYSDALAIDSSHIYWTTVDGRIGRANIDGSGANPNFITGLGGDLPGLAVDAAHIYWSSGSHIGRANIDGSEVDPTFLAANHAVGIAVDATHIYWGENETGHIARALLDGGRYQPEWIAAPGDPCSVAVDSGHVYWADATGNKIGRTDLSGTVVEPAFINPGAPVDCGVAVSSSYVYFGINGALVAPSTMARSNLDGSGLNNSLFSLGPYGGPSDQLAVDSRGALPAPGSIPNSFKLVGVFRNKRKGFARLKVKLPGGGTVVLFGKQVRKAVRRPRAAGILTLPVRPKRKLARRLRRRGKALASFKVRFKPTGGTPKTMQRQLWLVRNG